MNGPLVIGQYLPGDSLVHRLDPRVKMIILLSVAVAVLAARSVADYIIVGLFLILAVAFSRVQFTSLLKGLKWLWLFFIIMWSVQIFSLPGETLFILGPLSASKEGLLQATTMFMIIFVMIVAAMLLVATTSPFKLSAALENMMTPLKKLGVPVNDIALMITVAVRFLPVLTMEYDAILKAQRSRGMVLAGKGFGPGLRALVSLVVPLFSNSIRRAEELAVAMECRAYGLGANVTRVKSLQIASRDYVVLAVNILILSFIFFV